MIKLAAIAHYCAKRALDENYSLSQLIVPTRVDYMLVEDLFERPITEEEKVEFHREFKRSAVIILGSGIHKTLADWRASNKGNN